ncbi:hypothetical protein JAAARDRAFT_155747 [Jaapia argillacea MUCL 33604]|uniref:Uncharacterized protein n=1 Tax=Jaapia argillacea MUCL 33604 TaxID=933084 RepID=A0A067Q639_9AGAM|nr:hypothetical protein JAAARDRAFT_155747 [Jaapia argillacea MUCL 33604]
MKVLVLGGSRHIGYFSALRLLAKGHTVTFLLRKPAVFDGDEKVQPYISSGQARIVQGDAMKSDDVKHAWEAAGRGEPEGAVDLCLFTIGATTGTLSLTKGLIINPINVCTQSMMNVLCTMPKPATTKVVAVTSNGVGHSSHASLPLALKAPYSYLLSGCHRDKIGLERVLFHTGDKPYSEKEMGKEPGEQILEKEWRSREGLPGQGEFKDSVIVRPALMFEGECKGDEIKSAKGGKGPYRAAEGNLPGAWTISRQDVAHFIVEGILPEWEKWAGKVATIGY